MVKLAGRADRPKDREADTVFVVDVKFRQNATWQGTVELVGTDEVLNFRSALELLKIMDATLENDSRSLPGEKEKQAIHDKRVKTDER